MPHQHFLQTLMLLRRACPDLCGVVLFNRIHELLFIVNKQVRRWHNLQQIVHMQIAETPKPSCQQQGEEGKHFYETCRRQWKKNPLPCFERDECRHRSAPELQRAAAADIDSPNPFHLNHRTKQSIPTLTSVDSKTLLQNVDEKLGRMGMTGLRTNECHWISVNFKEARRQLYN